MRTVFLSNNYLNAFTGLLGSDLSKVFKNYDSYYVSEGHRGIGELRGRLKRVIKFELGEQEKSSQKSSPIFFHSGIANLSESAYLAASCAVGTSLSHTTSKKLPHLLKTLMTHVCSSSNANGVLKLGNGRN